MPGDESAMVRLDETVPPVESRTVSLAVPGLRRVAVIWDPATPSHAPALKAVEATGRALGLHKLPTMFGPREHVEAGGLMSYSPDRADLYRRAAIYVDKILKGANPADLPVQQATNFELVINLKTAKALGLTIPQPLLQRANHIID